MPGADFVGELPVREHARRDALDRAARSPGRRIRDRPVSVPKSAQEATWAKYEREAVVGGTQVTIEKRAEIIRREGHSPDHWDADIMALRQTQPGIFARTAGSPFLGKKAERPQPGNPLQPGSRLGNGRTRMPGSTAAREDGWKPWKPGAVEGALDGWRGR